VFLYDRESKEQFQNEQTTVKKNIKGHLSEQLQQKKQQSELSLKQKF